MRLIKKIDGDATEKAQDKYLGQIPRKVVPGKSDSPMKLLVRLKWGENSIRRSPVSQGGLLSIPEIGKGIVKSVQTIGEGTQLFSIDGIDVALICKSDSSGISFFQLPKDFSPNDISEILSELKLREPSVSLALSILSLTRMFDKFDSSSEGYGSSGEGDFFGGGSRIPNTPPIPDVPIGRARLKNRVIGSFLPFQEEDMAAEIEAFEEAGEGATGRQLESEYKDFIFTSAKIVLEQTGAEYEEKPFSKKTVEEMIGVATSLIWSNFTYSPTSIILEGVGNGNLDCDTSAYAVCDILVACGVDSSRISEVAIWWHEDGNIEGHAVLKVDGKYYETTSGKNGPSTLNVLTRDEFYSKYSDATSIVEDEDITISRPKYARQYSQGVF